MNSRLNLRTLSRVFILILECVAVLSLWSTDEVFRVHTLDPTQIPRLILAAMGALALLGISHFFKPTRRAWGLRILLSFVCLILSASITPEFYLFPATLLFATFAALAMIGLNVENELAQRPHLDMDTQVSFKWLILTTASLSFVFLLSIVIFPILPRPMQKGGMFGEGASSENLIGYQESIDLGQKLGFTSGQNRQTVLRVQWLSDDSVADERLWLRQGLVRGRVLDLFDGNEWRPRKSIELRASPKRAGSPIAHVYRAPLLSGIVPTPYGVGVTNLKVRGIDAPLHYTLWNEFTSPFGFQNELDYDWIPIQNEPLPPKIGVFALPRGLHIERWKKLAQRLILEPAVHQPALAVAALQTYFRRNFTARLPTAASAPRAGSAPINSKFSAAQTLEEFMFETRTGHCELFTTASAILLHLRGISSRAISGFRVPNDLSQKWTLLRQEDAHAWLEVWDGQSRWLISDATPAVPPGSFFDMLRSGRVFRDLRDQAESFWLDRIVGFQFRDGKFFTLDFFKDPFFWICVTLLVSMIGFLRRTKKAPSTAGGKKLGLFDHSKNRRLRRIARQLDHLAASDPMLYQAYERLRFSPVDLSSPEIKREVRILERRLRDYSNRPSVLSSRIPD